MKPQNENIKDITAKINIKVITVLKIPGMNLSENQRKNNVLFIITTYNRPESLIYLLDYIYGLGDIMIYNDGSSLQYYGLDRYKNLIYHKGLKNFGIAGYYNVINYIFGFIKTLKKYDYYIFCPDDFVPVDNFLEQAIHIYESIQEDKKICLNLYTDRGRFMRSSWTNYIPVIFNDVCKTQWIDMCFICKYEMFKAIDWKIKFPGYHTISSGVGKSMSIRLAEKYNIYQVKFSLFKCQPEGRKSKMYNQERHMNHYTEMLKHKLISPIENFTRICIASIPERSRILEKTIESLIDQCDSMYIILNNYKKIPDYLKTDKITAIISDNKFGDAGKFAGMERFNGYYFTCDDDIIYPENYVKQTINRLNFYGLNCILTYHGNIMNSKPLKSYYKGHSQRFNLFYDVKNDIRVDIPGSGVSAWHTKYFNFDYKRCIWPNMADIWLAKFANEQNIPIILMEHTGSDFKYQESTDNIYKTYSKDDEIQTQLYNNI